MRFAKLSTSLLAIGALAFAAAAAVAGEPGKSNTAPRGNAVAAKSVAPGEVKKFHVTASDGQISPAILRVKQGERVRITFVSKDSNYGIKFPDFEIKEKLTPEQPKVVELVASQKGTFEFRCTKMGLKRWSKNGTLVVN
jgi:plastocyanin domain-containing protein